MSPARPRSSKERHPTWTVEQIKSALEQTGDPVHTASGSEVLATREGGGIVDLPRADKPLIFAAPTGLSFGRLLRQYERVGDRLPLRRGRRRRRLDRGVTRADGSAEPSASLRQ